MSSRHSWIDAVITKAVESGKVEPIAEALAHSERLGEAIAKGLRAGHAKGGGLSGLSGLSGVSALTGQASNASRVEAVRNAIIEAITTDG
jgi:hypothetical protein